MSSIAPVPPPSPLAPGSTVAVLGAGPVGLAAAAHLVRRGLAPLVFEAGPAVGHSVAEWGHVRMFSPWRYNVDAAARQLLDEAGWRGPDLEALPTGSDLVVEYLVPLAELPAIATGLHLRSRVVAVGRDGLDKVRTAGREQRPFVLHVEGPDGRRSLHRAAAVIDASGTWTAPNPMGAGGLPAVGEAEAEASIAYGIPDVLGRDPDRYAGRRTLVVGSGHSAMNVLLDLARLHEADPATQLVWALRRPDPTRAYGGEDADGLPARGALGARLHRLVDAGAVHVVPSFYAVAVQRREHGVEVIGHQDGAVRGIAADEVVVATGFRPDLSFLRELRLGLDPALESVAALAPLIDPNVHSCGTVRPHGERELRQPEAGFYIAGVKSYGRAPTFLLATGYEQVRSVVAALAGDWEAASRMELDLPETGVCSTDTAGGDGAACCAAPAPSTVDAVAQAGAGCGCG